MAEASLPVFAHFGLVPILRRKGGGPAVPDAVIRAAVPAADAFSSPAW